MEKEGSEMPSGVDTAFDTGKQHSALDNSFAYEPGQLNKMLNPKSLGSFGGIIDDMPGIENAINHLAFMSAKFDGPSDRPCAGQVDEAPAPTPDSELLQYCHSGGDIELIDQIRRLHLPNSLPNVYFPTLMSLPDEPEFLSVPESRPPPPSASKAQPNLFDILTTDAAELQAIQAAGKLTSVDLVKASFDQIERFNHRGPQLNVTINFRLFRDTLSIARSLDDERSSGRVRGPLHGIPMTIKGSDGSEKASDMIACLERAGAVIVGKNVSNMTSSDSPDLAASPWSARYLSAGAPEHRRNNSTKTGESTRTDVGWSDSLDRSFSQKRAAYSEMMKSSEKSRRWRFPEISPRKKHTATSVFYYFVDPRNDEDLLGKDPNTGKDAYASDPLEHVKAYLAKYHHRQPQPTWDQAGGPDISGDLEDLRDLSRPHGDKLSWLRHPPSWLPSFGAALDTILRRFQPTSPASTSRPKRRPLSPSHTLLAPLFLCLLAGPLPTSAQRDIPPALLHIAAGTSFATSATIPPLRGNDNVPSPWWIAMYVLWGVAFTVFLAAELLSRTWAQQRLLLGLLLFHGLNLTGSLIQGDSMLEGMTSWGPLAMTATLWLVPVLMEAWGMMREGAGRRRGGWPERRGQGAVEMVGFMP